jgi:Protein of unknown function (DUF3551)
MTRMSIIALFVIAVVLLGETQFSNAQSPESYPWCGIRYTTDGSSQSCYYTSREQCMATMSGAAGGLCVESPYYRTQPTKLPHGPLVKPHHRRHARSIEEDQVPADRAKT